MMMENFLVKKNYEDLLEFVAVGKEFIHTNPKESKLSWAIKRVSDRIVTSTKHLNKNFQKKIQDFRIDFASEDANKNLIIEKDSYLYTKENKKLLDESIRVAEAALFAEVIEIETWFVESPVELTDTEKKVFDGIVIKSTTDDVQ